MTIVPNGTELARPFVPAKDLDLAKRFYVKLGFEKVLDSEVAVFRIGSSGFILSSFDQATLRQLLRHQAGLTDYGYLTEYHTAVAGRDEPWSDEEMLRRTEASRLRYSPGQRWQYSNIGYLYVRRLIEVEIDASLDAALHFAVLAPLDVTSPQIVETEQE